MPTGRGLLLEASRPVLACWVLPARGTGDNADPDDDNDGQTDLDEVSCGSDPFDEESMSPDFDGDNVPDCVDHDDDNDGVDDGNDVCAETVLPDVPTEGLTKNRYAATIDGFANPDGVVDYTLADTGGCSATPNN